MHETFTHLARDTSRDLLEAHLMETRRLRDEVYPRTNWKGLAQSHRAKRSPLGSQDMTLREVDVRQGLFGPELTNLGLAVAVSRRIRQMPLRGKGSGVVEAIRYVDDEGRPGWFFYGWWRLP